MISAPLFNKNILSNIYDNFHRYFLLTNAYQYFALTLTILFAAWLIAKYVFNRGQYVVVPPALTAGETNTASLRMASIAVVLSFALYVFRFSMEEQTVLNNYDSMNPSFMRALLYGVLPVFKGWRFTPFSHADCNIIFGITNNYWMIGWYCVLKQLLILYLMYKCFHFIEKSKRLYLIALINLVPAVFSINNIVFPEQNIIIFVLVGFMALDKYQTTGKPKYLLAFLLFMNFAIYVKETVILYYAGCGIYLLLDAIFVQKTINWSQIKKPWKYVRLFPVEWLMLVSFATWVIFYFINMPPLTNNRYLMTHYYAMKELMRVYAVELMLLLASVIIFASKIYKKEFNNMSLVMEGSVIGSILLVFYVVFWVRIVPSQDYAESYYLYLPAVFCTIYVFENIKKKDIAQLFAMLIFFASICQNYDFYINMQGNARHDLMEFIASKAPKKQSQNVAANADDKGQTQQREPVTVYFYSSKLKTDTVFWHAAGWKTSLQYLLPDRDIVVKVDDYYKQFVTGGYSYVKFSFETVKKGDYIIINRLEDPDLKGTRVLVYKNSVYDVYVME